MAQNWLHVGNGDPDRIRSAVELIAVLLGRACQLNASLEPPAMTESVTGTDLIQYDACDRTMRKTFGTYLNVRSKCKSHFTYYHMHIIDLFSLDHH